jgi:xanthine dehydrogenase accessory factor
MTDVFNIVADWLQEDSQVAIARIIAMDGFGGRRAGEVLVVSRSGEPDHDQGDESFVRGQLALGAANQATVTAALALLADTTQSAVSITVAVGDEAAMKAGLACGGQATVLIQRATTIPPEFLTDVANGIEVVLASEVATGASWVVNRSGAIQPDHPGAAPLATEAAQAAQRMLTKGPAGSALVDTGDRTIWIEAFIPEPRLVVLGVAALSGAITAQAGLMDWYPTVLSEADTDLAVEMVSGFGPSDGVVVLSHDLAASTHVLAAALSGRCGFVGALGSRHTQVARSEMLSTVHGLSVETIARIRGPVGLDLGARTPEETALAIVAEMLAVTRSRVAAPLTQSTGPING